MKTFVPLLEQHIGFYLCDNISQVVLAKMDGIFLTFHQTALGTVLLWEIIP